MRIRCAPAVKIAGIVVGTPLIGLTGMEARAVELTPNAAILSSYTNNSGRSAQNKESELEISLSAGLGLQSSSERYDYQLNYAVTRTHYEHDTFDDRTVTVGNANANFTLLTDRLVWQVMHFQDYNKIDAQAADTPDNRTERSVFQTGPQIFFDFSPVDRVIVDGRYIKTRFDNLLGNDSERSQVNVTWGHRYSELGTLSVIGRYSDTEFDDETIKYEQTGAGLGLSRLLKNGRYAIEFGKSKIERENDNETEANFLNVELDLRYGTNTIAVTFIRDLTDSSLGLGLANDTDRDFDSGDTNFDVVDIVQRDRGQITYRRENIVSSGSVQLSVFRDRDDFKIRQDDEVRTGLATKFDYDWTARDSLELLMTYEEVDSIDNELSGLSKQRRADVVWVRKLSSRFEMRLGLHYEERDNSEQALQEYDRSGGLLGLYYRPD